VQHALRAYTPEDAKALKATVSTFPRSSYDLEEVLTSLGIGEAVVTVLSERGAPTPVAWTRLRAPQSLMAPTEAAAAEALVRSSPLYAEYAQEIDRDSAYERLSARVQPPPAAQQPPAPTPGQADPLAGVRTPTGGADRRRRGRPAGEPGRQSFARSAASALGREITRSIFGTARRSSRRRR
jgi:hypothetical protein